MRPTSTQAITLANSGMASAYVVLPLGKFRGEVERLREATKTHEEKRRKERKSSDITLEELVYAFGHADLLARFRIDDMRSMLRFHYPAESDASVLNFILSVPCHRVVDPDGHKKTMRFAMHLRLRRGAYAEGEPVANEHGIIGYLCDRLLDAGCDATIHVALGWADLIIDGAFDSTNMQRFARFLLDVHEGSVIGPDDDRRGVFQRTITILGLPWPDTSRRLNVPALGHATPVVFVRAEPGYLLDSIQRVAANPPMTIRLIDGKSDFVAFAEKSIPKFLLKNLELSSDNLSKSTDHHRIQKLETHLVFSKLEVDKARRKRTIVGKTTKALPEHCRCLKNVSSYDVSAALPESLRQSIDNLLFLFHSTLHDPMSCCDVEQAIHAAKQALTRLSALVDDLNKERRRFDRHYKKALRHGDEETAEKIHARCRGIQGRIDAKLHQLDVWHLLAERVLRQRTVAAFDALLLQSDRSVVYRGSVQKFLFLADALMNDFAVRISPWEGVTPRFSAMGDSVPRIVSVQGMGLVRIPPHHVFTLPFVIPDLWHEVGVYWFFRYVEPEKFTLNAPDRDTDQELGELGDLYGDLVVLQHGFLGRFNRFAFSLMRAWLDSYDSKLLARSVYVEKFDDLLCRLAFVLIVADTRDNFLDEVLKPTGDAVGNYIVKTTHESFKTYFKEVPALTDKRRRIVTSNLIKKLRRYGRTLHDVFKETIAEISLEDVEREDFLESSNGELIPFRNNHDLNVVMGELYWQFQLNRMSKVTKGKKGKAMDSPFRRMASVVRSAIIEYHRRQANP